VKIAYAVTFAVDVMGVANVGGAMKAMKRRTIGAPARLEIRASYVT
jgi:hypothetical protein